MRAAALAGSLVAGCDGAGTVQALPPDDAALDASPVDVARLDASTLDASTLDASTLDASTLDATTASDLPRADVVTNVVTDVPASAHPPRGALDNTDCRGLWGWALDDDATDVSLAVRVHTDVTDVTGVASGPRPDVCAPRPGACNHGFDLPLPDALRDGRDHPAEVYARDATDGREALVARGVIRCGDAGVTTPVDAPVDARAVDFGTLADDRIQAEVTQECTDGDGVTFRVRPTHPVRGIEGYSFTWRVTSGSTRLSLNETRDRAHVVLVGDGVPAETHLELVVFRLGYRTLVIGPETLWSSACAHEFNPTRCPENLRAIAADSDYYARGQSISLRADEAPAGDVNWYVNQGLDGVSVDAAGHAMRAAVTRDPAVTVVVTQAQPASDPRSADTARCHGWTQRYFVVR